MKQKDLFETDTSVFHYKNELVSATGEDKTKEPSLASPFVALQLLSNLLQSTVVQAH